MDMEKVVKGLECCTFILGKRKCNECPYEKTNGCYQLQDDFHALLKEQEPVCVYEAKINKCACGNIVNRYYHPKFCGCCGKELMWY